MSAPCICMVENDKKHFKIVQYLYDMAFRTQNEKSMFLIILEQFFVILKYTTQGEYPVSPPPIKQVL